VAIENPVAVKSSQAPIRKTIDLDDDVVEILREAVCVEGRSRNAVINDAFRRVFGAGPRTGHGLQHAVPTQNNKLER
jgi:hypothetical protein